MLDAMTTAATRFVTLAATAALLSLGAGAAFAAWAEHGAGIFLAMASTGIAWCF